MKLRGDENDTMNATTLSATLVGTMGRGGGAKRQVLRIDLHDPPWSRGETLLAAAPPLMFLLTVADIVEKVAIRGRQNVRPKNQVVNNHRR